MSCSEVLFPFWKFLAFFKNKEILCFLEKESMACLAKLI